MIRRTEEYENCAAAGTFVVCCICNDPVVTLVDYTSSSSSLFFVCVCGWSNKTKHAAKVLFPLSFFHAQRVPFFYCYYLLPFIFPISLLTTNGLLFDSSILSSASTFYGDVSMSVVGGGH